VPNAAHAIGALVARSRKRLLLHHAARWLLETAALATALVGVALVLTGSLPLSALRLGLGATLAAVAAGLALRAAWPLRLMFRPLRLASLLEARLPELRHWLRGALELQEALRGPAESLGFSPALAEAHIAETARRAVVADLSPLGPWRELRWPALAAALAGLALALAAAGAPQSWERRVALLWSGEADASGAGAATRQGPLVGDLVVVLRAPAYAGLPPRQLNSSDGAVTGLRGSAVELSGRLLEAGEQAFVLLQGEQEQRLHAALEGERLSARFVLERDGSYRFGLSDEAGDARVEARPRPLKVIPDRHPEVRLEEPAADLDLDEAEPLEVVFRAEDDFGFSRVELVLEFMDGDEPAERRPLLAPGELQGRELNGRSKLSLLEMGLQPGDRIQFYVEAADNDTVGGPKVGSSARRVVRILSGQERHDRSTAQARQVWEAMIRLLATRLELPPLDRAQRWPTLAPPVQEMLAETAATLQLSTELLGALEKDPLASTAVHAAFRSFRDRSEALFRGEQERFVQLEDLRARGRHALGAGQLQLLAQLGQQSAEELEQSILAIDRLLDRQQTEDLAALGKDLMQAQDRLRELLRQYKETQDPALRRQIEREMRRLAQRIEDLMRRLAAQMKKLPFEHLNRDALAGESVQAKALDFQEQMKALQERFDAGDVQGALDALERFSSGLQGMMDALERDARAEQNDGIDQVRAEMGAVLEELQELQGAQESLEQETAALEQAEAERRRKAMQRELKQQLDELLRKVERIEERLGDVPEQVLSEFSLDSFKESREATELLRGALGQREVDQGLEISRSLERALGSARSGLPFVLQEPSQAEAKQRARAAKRLEQAEKLATEVREALEKLLDTPPPPGGQGQEQAERLGQRQQELAERTRRAQERLQGLEGGEPLQSGEMGQGLGEAANHMGEARSELQGGRPGPARAPQQRALQKLGQVAQQLRLAVKPQRMGQEQGSPGGGGNPDTDRVRIPNAQDYRGDAEQRQRVLEAMKQGSPESYREQLRRYYRELLK